MPSPLTGLLHRRRAWIIILGLLGLALLLPWRSYIGLPASRGGGADQSLYTVEIQRIHDGESYYTVLGDELRRRHFPTASPFNWRTPLLFCALALNPLAGRVVFVALGVIVLGATVRLLINKPTPVVVVGALAQSGAIWVIFDPGVWVYHETWIGLLIALSLFAYVANRHVLGAALGVIALFLRELAAPYVVLGLVLAVRARRWREVQLWMAGSIAYAFHYAWHVLQVLEHQRPDEPAHGASWIQFGGLPFVASTLRTNSYVHEAPVYVTSVVLLVVLAGLLSAAVHSRVRLTVAVYFALFTVVGLGFNWYWGWITGFVVPVVFAHGAWELVQVLRAAVRDSPPGLATVGHEQR